jgi:exodeoxyribonuclease V alpha subunit
MQVANDDDKEVYNGDLGVVRAINPEASEIVIEFDSRQVTYGLGELEKWCSHTRQPFTSRKALSIRS